MLLSEYQRQQKWRNWDRYLEKIPLSSQHTVYDLGCSLGEVSRLFAATAKTVTGFDTDPDLLAEARRTQPSNCRFILKDITTLTPAELEPCDGIWLSYVLAYISAPEKFISRWSECLRPGGWFAIADIDGLFSSHLPLSHPFFPVLEDFEETSAAATGYDFRIGRKIKQFMTNSGLVLATAEDDWYDCELNFQGAATPEVLTGWNDRLSRMSGLRNYLGNDYSSFCQEFLALLSKEDHQCRRGVRFYVGIKP